MNRAWVLFKSHPYVSNVAGYTTLFATADLIQQSTLGRRPETTPSGSGDSFERNTSGGTTVNLGNTERGKHGIPSEASKIESLGIRWDQTLRVALVGFCFHANFNYQWLKALERMFPGGGAKRVALKVLLDQLIAAPATISAFYIGLSALEGKEDPFEDWRNKFWTSYKTGVVYWSSMQAVNFSLVPPVARTVFVGGVTLVWTVFLCHFRQRGSSSDSTA